MSIQITVTAKDAKDAQAILKLLNGKTVEVDSEEEEEAPRRSKSAKEKDLDEDEELDTEEETDEDEESYTLSDVIKAFKNYVTENDRKGAAKILSRMGVKSVKDLKPKQFGDVMELLKD